jgi:ectoine hydroxylase-related dioxygenase (phytanoyl-CoA dioxygenase family)
MSPAEQLDQLGYAVIPDVCPPTLLQLLRDRVEQLFELEGENAGAEFRQEPHARRLANLMDKGEAFQQAISSTALLDAVQLVLGPKFKLSSLNARSTNAFAPDPQPMHVDMGLLPDERGNKVCNCIWMLDGFTSNNGATRVVPGSHKWNRRPQDFMDDPTAAHPEEVLVLGPAGSVVVMNAHCWHGGTANQTDRPRRAMHSFFCRDDVPQQQYQKRLLRPETQASLSPRLRQILALDDPENDRLSENPGEISGFMKK